MKNIPAGLRVIGVLVLSMGIVSLWLLIRPTPSSELRAIADFDRVIASGKPTLLEFYSEY